MPRKPKYRKPYPPEFRREVVTLYARTDRTHGEIAGDLGVSRESLRLWVQQAQIERGERDGLTVSGTQTNPSCCSGVFVDESAESVASVELVWLAWADEV